MKIDYLHYIIFRVFFYAVLFCCFLLPMHFLFPVCQSFLWLAISAANALLGGSMPWFCWQSLQQWSSMWWGVVAEAWACPRSEVRVASVSLLATCRAGHHSSLQGHGRCRLAVMKPQQLPQAPLMLKNMLGNFQHALNRWGKSAS